MDQPAYQCMENSNYQLDAMLEKSLILYESSRQEAIHDMISEKKLRLEVFNQVVMEEAAEEFRNIQQKFLSNAIDKIKQYEKECQALYEEVIQKESEFDKKPNKNLQILKAQEKAPQMSDELLNQQKQVEKTKNLVTASQVQVQQDDQAVLKNDQDITTTKQISDDKVNMSQEFKEQPSKAVIDTNTTILDMELEKAPDDPGLEKKTKSKTSKQEKVLKDAIELQKFIFDFESSIKEFTENPNMKSYINELQLFIRTLINTISNGSVSQLRNKALQLHNLFSKKSVYFQEKNIDCNKHPKALEFSIYFAAKTFISVGAKQIASLAKAAFPMGAIIALLWSHHKLFGQLFVGLLQDKCPFAIPYYPVKGDKDSETDYYIACGYNLAKDGKTLESEETYLNRMRAMVMLYAAALQTPLPPKTSYQSFNTAWRWLSSMLNFDPKPVISAAIIQAFTQISSFTMLQLYGKQYFKLLKYISSDYLSKIKEITGKDSKRQTLVQLEIFTEESVKNILIRGSLQTPEGFVPSMPVDL